MTPEKIILGAFPSAKFTRTRDKYESEGITTELIVECLSCYGNSEEGNGAVADNEACIMALRELCGISVEQNPINNTELQKYIRYEKIGQKFNASLYVSEFLFLNLSD